MELAAALHVRSTGGPDFDRQYLLPELDRLADAFRLIYYDQRRRGRSAEGVRAEDVTIQSEVEDIECLRRQFQLESLAVLGHCSPRSTGRI